MYQVNEIGQWGANESIDYLHKRPEKPIRPQAFLSRRINWYHEFSPTAHTNSGPTEPGRSWWGRRGGAGRRVDFHGKTDPLEYPTRELLFPCVEDLLPDLRRRFFPALSLSGLDLISLVQD